MSLYKVRGKIQSDDVLYPDVVRQRQPLQRKHDHHGHLRISGDVSPDGAFVDLQLPGGLALREPSAVQQFLELFASHRDTAFPSAYPLRYARKISLS